MSKDVNLGKVWIGVAETLVNACAGVIGSVLDLVGHLNGNSTAREIQRITDESFAKIDAEKAITVQKRKRLVELRKAIPVTDQRTIPGRPNTRFIGIVTSSSGHRNDDDAWLDFFARVKELNADAVIGMRFQRSKGGYIHIQGNALAPVETGCEQSGHR